MLREKIEEKSLERGNFSVRGAPTKSEERNERHSQWLIISLGVFPSSSALRARRTGRANTSEIETATATANALNAKTSLSMHAIEQMTMTRKRNLIYFCTVDGVVRRERGREAGKRESEREKAKIFEMLGVLAARR